MDVRFHLKWATELEAAFDSLPEPEKRLVLKEGKGGWRYWLRFFAIQIVRDGETIWTHLRLGPQFCWPHDVAEVSRKDVEGLQFFAPLRSWTTLAELLAAAKDKTTEVDKNDNERKNAHASEPAASGSVVSLEAEEAKKDRGRHRVTLRVLTANENLPESLDQFAYQLEDWFVDKYPREEKIAHGTIMNIIRHLPRVTRK